MSDTYQCRLSSLAVSESMMLAFHKPGFYSNSCNADQASTYFYETENSEHPEVENGHL